MLAHQLYDVCSSINEIRSSDLRFNGATSAAHHRHRGLVQPGATLVKEHQPAVTDSDSVKACSQRFLMCKKRFRHSLCSAVDIQYPEYCYVLCT